MLQAGASGEVLPLPERLCRVCTETIGISGAALSLISESYRETIGASNDVAARIEELQLTLGEGPCVDASTSGEPLFAPDLIRASALARWPGFAPAAVAAGVKAVFGFPLAVGAVRVGALDLYRDTPGELDDDEVTDALLLADMATAAVLNAQADAPAGDDPLHWQDEDFRGRHAVVHQATGILLVQLDVPIEEAFLRLRAYAFATDRRLSDVADDIVGHRLRVD
jgi:GAF domain-containing protein